jgi:outer membrane protein assembly factor BamD (BamD/ComL family)
MRRLGLTASALRDFKTAAESGPASPARAYAWAALAALEDSAGRTRAAERAVARASAEAQDWKMRDLSADLALSKANLLFKTRRLAEAAAAYGEFQDRHSSHPQATLALYQKGLALRRLDRAQAAAAAFQELLEKHPESVFAADAHLQLGQLHAQLGDASKAVAHYQSMPGSEADLLVAQVHYNSKRYKQAIPRYQAFLDAHPRDRRAQEVEDLLLNAYWLGDRDNPEMERAAARYPKHAVVARIRWELASRAYRSGDAALAVDLLQRYRVDFPKAPQQEEALYLQARSHLKLGQNQTALTCFERLKKRNDDAWWWIARLREQAGRASEAAAAYERVGGKNRSAAVYAAARLREKLGQKSAAAALYASMKSIKPAADPARLKGMLRLALLNELAGKKRQALPLYGEILKHAPKGGPDFEAARQRVQSLTEKL